MGREGLGYGPQLPRQDVKTLPANAMENIDMAKLLRHASSASTLSKISLTHTHTQDQMLNLKTIFFKDGTQCGWEYVELRVCCGLWPNHPESCFRSEQRGVRELLDALYRTDVGGTSARAKA